MKKIIYILAGLCFFTITKAQVTAQDCTTAVNVCTNNSFSVSPAGAGFIDFTTASNVSNPTSNPVGVVPTGGFGCLKAGELNPTWMIINIQTPGTLEFSMGAGTGPGAQSGCYDWIMWPYNATTCSGINANTQAPIRCCWNAVCSGGTGLASAANLPAGGSSQDYGAPINANCGDKFIMCFSNYSSVSTLVPLNFFGTAIVSCSPLSSTLSINSAAICPGGVATLSVASSPGTTYTWQPGGQTAPSITVSPAVTTNYTLLATNACGTFSGTTSVVVSPAMSLSFSNTNGTCVPATLGSSTVTVSGGSSPYTYTWSPTGGTSASASGLTTGTYSVTVTDALGCTATSSTNIIAPAPFSFSLSVGSNSIITCTNNSVVITASSSSTLSNVTYTWTSPSSATTTGTSFTATAPGTYTVVGGDQTVGSCTDTQSIVISQNGTIPSIAVNPTSTQTIICNGACAQFTATTSGTANIIGTWDGPSGQVVPPTGTPMLLCANAPGTYTANFCSTISGCCATQTVAVVSNTSVPTLSINVATSNGFTINCTNPNVVMNVNSSGTCAPVGYTWTPLGNPSASVTPVTGGYTVTVPGQYEATFHDCNLCYVTTTVNIYIDTLRPSPSSITNLPSNGYTINCYNPTLIATGVTNPLLSAGQYSWTVPGPLTFPSNTIMVSMGTFTGTTTSINYTVSAIGPNGCVGKQRVTFYKDATVPAYVPVCTPSIGITCANLCVAMSPSSTSTVPITYTFTSPPPTQTATTSGALMCVPGAYTMNYINMLNGCPGVGTVNVASNVVPPAINNPANVFLPCGQTTTVVSANTVTTSPTYSYSWVGPPGSAMSCLGGTACASPSVNMPGTYFVTILNTLNGCRSTNAINVVANGINAGFIPDPVEGFSPLTVNFSNTSSIGSSTSGSLTTFWNFGNGITYTTSGLSTNASTVLTSPSSIYQSAGSYTVTLVVAQYAGTVACVGTATAVIKVELPSKMDVPNVFTPNGDGVNDVFMLQTTNLTNITCTIFDRWGVKMYDVSSEKGNIEWDGKNLSKKEVPDGTYYYILKATGKDVRDYEQKGTISLYH